MSSYTSSHDHHDAEQERRRRERAHRRAARRRKARMRQLTVLSVFFVAVLSVTAAFALIDRAVEPASEAAPEPEVMQAAAPAPVPAEPEVVEPEWAITRTADTKTVPADFPSKYSLLLELESGEVLAENQADARINPASMTKILTLLTAAEHVTEEQLETGSFTMTRAVGDYCFVNNCSNVGYEVDEVIPMIELFYGCILCSGADACLGLAETIFGSHEAMVEAMNEKVAELGLSDTSHFTNCVGLYDEDLYTTPEDLAIILRAALENDLCREVLNTITYMSVPTQQHPEGQVLSNLFSRRIQYQDTGSVEVTCAKTGYVEESGFCAASYGTTADGTGYICVTAMSTGTQQSIRDHAQLYRTYVPADEPAAEE